MFHSSESWTLAALILIILYNVHCNIVKIKSYKELNKRGVENIGNDFGPPLQISSDILYIDKGTSDVPKLHTNWRPIHLWPPVSYDLPTNIILNGESHYDNGGHLLSNNKVENAGSKIPILDLDQAQKEKSEKSTTSSLKIRDNVDFKHFSTEKYSISYGRR